MCDFGLKYECFAINVAKVNCWRDESCFLLDLWSLFLSQCVSELAIEIPGFQT